MSQEKYDEVVKIEKFVNQMHVKDVAYRGVLTELSTLEPRVDVVDYNLELPTCEEVNPDFVVETELSTEDLVAPDRKISVHDFKLVKGSHLTILPYLPKITSMFAFEYGSVEQGLLAFNDKRVDFPLIAMIKMKDKAYLAKPINGACVIHSVSHDVAKTLIAEQVAESLIERISPYIDALFLTMQMAIGIYLGNADWNTHDDPIRREANWAQMMDDESDLSDDSEDGTPEWARPGYQPPRFARSTVNDHRKTKQKEYCRDHHTEDYCYVTESKRIKKIYGELIS